MRRLYGTAIDRPAATLGAALAAGLLLLPGLFRLELQTGGRALVPAGEPAIVEDRAIRELFGIGDVIAVVVESPRPEGIYNPHTLRLVAELTGDLRELPGVAQEDVVSLATEPGLRMIPGTLRPERWLTPLPETPEAIARLRAEVDDVGVYRGTLVSSDARSAAAAILVELAGDRDPDELYRRIRDVVARRPAIPDTVHVVGAPVAESQLGRQLLEDLALLVRLALLALAAVFALAFRSAVAVAIPLLEVGLALGATLGLMGWTGTPVYLTVAVLPVILVAIGVADEVHVFHAYLRELHRAPGRARAESLRRALDETWRPVAQTSLTTALGFLSFALSPILPVRAFGLFTAFGIGVSLLATLTVVPALLALAAPRWPANAPPEPLVRLRSLAAGIGGLALRRPRTLVAALAVPLLLAPLAIGRVQVQDSWLSGFAPGSELHRSTRRIEELFAGTHLLRVHVDARAEELQGRVGRDAFEGTGVLLAVDPTEHPGRFLDRRFSLQVAPEDPVFEAKRGLELQFRVAGAEARGGTLRLELEHPLGEAARILPSLAESFAYAIDARERALGPRVMAQIGDFETYLEEAGAGQVLGPWEYVATSNYVRLGRPAGGRVVPGDARQVRSVLHHYESARGTDKLRELYTPDFASCLVTAFVGGADYVTTARLIEAVRRYEERHFRPLGIAAGLAGDLAESQVLVGSIVETQLRSLLLSLAAVLLVSVLRTRSLVLGALCVLPAALAVVGVFAGMGLTGVPLGVATSMFAAMTLGLGVDPAIHLLHRYRRGDGVAEALARCGPPILVDALAIGLGFGLLTLSSVPANARLGALVLLSTGICLLASLVLLPALLRLRSRDG